MRRLAQLLSIKQGESRMASLVIGIMLFTSMGAALGGTGIEALFFARFGVEYLPYMFVGLGFTSMLMSFGVTAALGRIPRRILYISLPLFIALVLIGARFALFTGLSLLYPALWLGKEILNSLISILVWGIAGTVCDTRQAKRLFPLFNASRIFGQVVGGFVTGALVIAVGIENLLIIWASAMLFAFFLSRALIGNQQIGETQALKSRRRQPALIQEMQRGYQYVRGSRLMRWISFSAILFSILYFSIALPFSRAATEQYANEDALASFLGLFNGLSTAAAFLASLFLANRLFARFGIMACILAFPVIYLIGFGSLALIPTFIIVVSFRFLQMLWLSGIADPAWQTMFNVVPPERRDQVRTFIGGVPEQAGTFLAGTILIIGEQTLAPQQLYLVGLFAAALCTYAIYQARHGYNDALLDALRAGRPTLFFSEEQPFGGFRQDAVAVKAALGALRDPDPKVRRVSADILGHLSLPEAINELVEGLRDSDALVRASCLRALTQSHASSALLDIAVLLHDPEPDIRFEVVTALSALSTNSSGLIHYLAPMLDDDEARVSTRAAVSILRIPSIPASPAGFLRERAGDEEEIRTKAKTFIRHTAILGDLPDREHALTALGDWRDVEAFDFLTNEIKDPGLPISIRRIILTSIFRIDPDKAIPYLINGLEETDFSLKETVANLFGQIGPSALNPVIEALQNPNREEGALLALQNLPLPPTRSIENFSRGAVARAVEYDSLMRGIKAEVRVPGHNGSLQTEAMNLLIESLHHKSHKYGIHALQAIGLLGDRETIHLAIENLQTRAASQRANVIEALESINTRWRDIIQPLMHLWEEEDTPNGKVDWPRLLSDDDAWIRDCALFAAHKLGVTIMENIATLSLMERILFFKRVPLFANLSPTDLKQLAAIAQEELFSDGDTIVQEGEAGDVMFIIVEGEVRVITMKDQQEVELARRKAGEFVGEMALISKEPRIATLTAVGNVRALCIDQKSFEVLLRDRPDVSQAVIQVLAKRLKEISRPYS